MAARIKKPIPPLTCNHIDRVQELIGSLVNMSRDDDISDDILEIYVKIINEELEFIRKSNDELRVASKFWYDKFRRNKR